MAKSNDDTKNMMTTGQAVLYVGVGRRKRSVARVRVYAGESENLINGKLAADYTQTLEQKKKLIVPFTLSGLTGKYFYTAKVIGGGPNSQIEAVIHGVSRAIAKMSDSLKATMSQNGLLTRDPREKERKKIYHVRARKMPQFSKR
jgi:small subunit ribosomal protein S9